MPSYVDLRFQRRGLRGVLEDALLLPTKIQCYMAGANAQLLLVNGQLPKSLVELFGLSDSAS